MWRHGTTITLAKLLPSGFFQWDSIHCLLLGVEHATESSTPASHLTVETLLQCTPLHHQWTSMITTLNRSTTMTVRPGFRLRVSQLTTTWGKNHLDLDKLDNCNHPLRNVSPEQVPRLLLSFHRNSLDSIMGRISVRLNTHRRTGRCLRRQSSSTRGRVYLSWRRP